MAEAIMKNENRKKLLLGFGALAVVVVVALVLWAPSFRNDEAAGTIGAVQKHRAPQITRQDVILGNETTRHTQNVLYGDFLKDAARLQSINAQVASRNVAAARAELKNAEAELMTRYLESVKQVLAAEELLSRQQVANEELASEIAEASAMAHRELSQIEREELNGKLKHIAAQYEAKAAAAREQGMKAAHRELSEAVAELQSRKQAEARASLQSAEQELAARDLFARELAARSLMAETEYLAAMSLEMKALNNVEEQFAKSQLDNVGEELASQAQTLESRAAQNIEAEMNNEAEMAAMFHDMESQLASARQLAGNEEMASRALNEIEQTLASRKQELGARVASNVEFELASVDEYLSSRKQFGSEEQAAQRTQLAHMLANLQEELAAKNALASMMQNEEQLASRAKELAGRFR
jgi:hypothetical protein